METNLEKLEQEITFCRKCPRLVQWREEVARVRRRAYLDWDYWGKPVPGFGDPKARLLILGLAPGAHGSNRTGRMFTGDGSGNFLFPALYRAGFANQPDSKIRSDGLELHDCWLTASGRCAPPGNKPTIEELRNCQPWLESEISLLPDLQGIVVLGKIALDSLLKLPGFSELPRKEIVFGHGAFYHLRKDLPWILCSYHPSLQNTQTGRLTVEMFDQIWQQARERLV
ncbi:MAG TPA: uracil-DNA glycosylase [Anaerolineaceae bacterium]|jgi:uracil-DNA glycosylase family 4|nr:uracil-DNA glycosylase [Anaerolineaceae bacterium]